MKGFTVHDLKLRLLGFPKEDAYKIDDSILAGAVADGVTRDCANGSPLRKTPSGLLSALFFYPRFSNPAGTVSKWVVSEFLGNLKDSENKDEKAIYNAIKAANEAAKIYNDFNFPNPDFLVNDLAGCTFAGAVRDHKQGALHWGYICDSGVAILDDKGNLKFKTDDDGPAKHDPLIWSDERLQELTWSDPKARYTVRRYHRNNIIEPSFGVINGQPGAMDYVITGTHELTPEDSVLIYTDGLENIMFENGDIRGEFADVLSTQDCKQIKRFCAQRVKSEGTLIYE